MIRRLAHILLHVGIAVCVLGLSKVHAVIHGYDYSESARFGYSIGLIALMSLSAYGMGLPDLITSAREGAVASLKATVLATVVLSIIELPLATGALPRFVSLGSVLVLSLWFWLISVLFSGVSARRETGDRLMLVATRENQTAVKADLSSSPERKALLVAAMTPATARRTSNLTKAIDETTPDVVILDRAALGDERIVDQAAVAHARGVRIRTLSVFYNEWLGKLPISELEKASLMFDISELHKARYGRIKRVFDVILGASGTALLAIAIPSVLMGNLAANRGPLFYRQARVGRNGQTFDMLKFRTMRHDPGSANEWTSEGDVRITRFGNVLRRTHIDELPQVINILRGDISLVGPRPEQPHYVAALSSELPFYPLRHAVSPGLTGWAQVKFGYAGNETDALEKLQYDFYYLLHQGTRLDLKVLGRTIRSVLGLSGR
ncbi:MAG TPA: sugar transferase [Actinomycetota bacterium]|nr:sugar transferase [Actinomycetota bacterium]